MRVSRVVVTKAWNVAPGRSFRQSCLLFVRGETEAPSAQAMPSGCLVHNCTICMSRSLTRFPSINHYCRPGRQYSRVGSINRPQASEMEPGLIPLQVTGAYLL